jgi:protein-S-isoprenylcysteine O-methyltransferase Ste14
VNGPPARYAWVFILFGLVFFFLEVLRLAFTLTGLPNWLQAAGLCAVSIGLILWTVPQAPRPNP